MSPHFPLHLDLRGRRVLVVGAGPVGLRRATALLAAGAAVEMVALEVGVATSAVDGVDLGVAAALQAVLSGGTVTAGVRTSGLPAALSGIPLALRAFAPADLDGAWLVLACTGTVDDQIAALCQERALWCVRADDAAQSAAWVPAVARVDDVVVSVTAGRDPRRAVALRDGVALALDTGGLPLRRSRTGAGSVALVGGGPGDPDLLTVRGRRLLAQADVVVRDRLAPQLDLPAGVEVLEVGKTGGGPSWSQRDIEVLLVERARSGQRVVRLKGGDVHVFARGIEEVAACLAAGVEVEVVPGISSALAGPTLAGIPVTGRGVNQSFTVVSAHLPPGDPGSTVDWDALARLGGTVVLLMAIGRLGACCTALVAGGRDAGTPVAVVQDATLPTQRTVVTTLARAAVDAAGVSAPAVVVVGEVVDLRLVATP